MGFVLMCEILEIKGIQKFVGHKQLKKKTPKVSQISRFIFTH